MVVCGVERMLKSMHRFVSIFQSMNVKSVIRTHCVSAVIASAGRAI